MSPSFPAPGSNVLVTGASGFVAVHCCKALLDNGYKVKGTVRSNAKGDYLKDLFKDQPFEYVIVEDVGSDGAFNDAVKGVDGILHTASPFHNEADDPQELIRPAVDGTVNILKAAHEHGKDIKRIVITSSVASIMEPADPPKTFTEKDWNEFSPKEVEEKGKDSGSHKYTASKTLAEKAAWKFVKDNDTTFGLATICPPYVFGPILHQVEKADRLNTSVASFYEIMKGGKTEKDLPGPLGNWVDVREVAHAHFKALTTPEAEGERFIVSAGPFCTQDFTNFLNTVSPALEKVPKGKEGAAKEVNDPSKALVFSGEKASKVLGVKYRTIDETANDMYEAIKARGF